MRSFTDANGKDWPLVIDMTAVKRVEKVLSSDYGQINLANVMEPVPGDTAMGPDGKPRPLLTRLQLELVLAADVLYALCKPTATERGVTDEEFGRILRGDVMAKALAVFWQELEDFFQSLRPEAAQAVTKQQQVLKAARARMAGAISQVDPEQIAEQVAKTALTGLPGSSPASSESTPAR